MCNIFSSVFSKFLCPSNRYVSLCKVNNYSSTLVDLSGLDSLVLIFCDFLYIVCNNLFSKILLSPNSASIFCCVERAEKIVLKFVSQKHL